MPLEKGCLGKRPAFGKRHVGAPGQEGGQGQAFGKRQGQAFGKKQGGGEREGQAFGKRQGGGEREGQAFVWEKARRRRKRRRRVSGCGSPSWVSTGGSRLTTGRSPSSESTKPPKKSGKLKVGGGEGGGPSDWSAWRKSKIFGKGQSASFSRAQAPAAALKRPLPAHPESDLPPQTP